MFDVRMRTWGWRKEGEFRLKASQSLTRRLGRSNEVHRRGEIARAQRGSLARVDDAILDRGDRHHLVGRDQDAAQRVLASAVGRGSLGLRRHGHARHTSTAASDSARDGVGLV